MKAKKGQHVDSIYGHDDPITGRRVCTECFNLHHHPHRDVGGCNCICRDPRPARTRQAKTEAAALPFDGPAQEATKHGA